MTEREALKLALEALKQIDEAMPFPVAKLAQSAIKEALAQPEPEYMAFMDTPQRKPLTDEEMHRLINEFFYEGIQPSLAHCANFARAIEAAIWEKQK